MRFAVLLALLAGCGVKEDAFQTKYVEAHCDFAVQCYSDDVLQFYGWDSAETCVSKYGPEYAGKVDGCAYDKKNAKACLKAMKNLSCPTDGSDPVDPDICGQVYDCSGVDSDSDSL